MPFDDHFSDRAAAYARGRPTYPEELADFLAASAPRREHAWEAGCGSGQLSGQLGERFRRVRATDASEAQIAHAPRHANVEYRVAPAEASGLPATSVDLAVAAQAAHWFDLDAYYAEVRRVARPGAALVLVSYGLFRVDEAIDRIVERFYSEVLGRHWPPNRRHVETGYRSLPFPFTELATPSLQIRHAWTLPELLDYLSTWSAVRALGRAGETAPFFAFRDDLARAWETSEAIREIRWPLNLRAARL